MQKRDLPKAAKTLLIGAMLLATVGILLTPSVAIASHYQAFPGGTSTNFARPFGYVTTTTESGVHGDPSPTQFSDIDETRKLDESIVDVTLHVSGAAMPTGTTQDFLNALTSASNAWDASDPNTEQPSFTILQDNLAVPSAGFGANCPGSSNINDGIFAAGWCDLGAQGPLAEVHLWPNEKTLAADGGADVYTEADMAFNEVLPAWTVSEMNDVARHEFGHLFGLGDLYPLYSGCNTPEAPFGDGSTKGPVMCDSTSPVSTRDTYGLFYLYPLSETLSITEPFNHGAETDMAITELTGSASTTKPEFVVLEVDEDVAPSPDVQHFIVKPFLDMDPNTYEESGGVQDELFTQTINAINDVGLSIVNIGKTSKPDMIVSWVDSDYVGHWKVYWDISLTSTKHLQWASVSSTQTIPEIGISTDGIDTVFMSTDSDAALEMMIFKSRFDGVHEVLEYSYVELDSTTGAAVGSWTHVTNTGITLEDDELGAAIIDDTKRLVAITYNAEDLPTAEYLAYKVLHFPANSGTIDESSARQLTSLESSDPNSGSFLDGSGADAYSWSGVGVNGGQYKDLVILWTKDQNTFFTVDRDTRYNGHGTSDNSDPGGLGVYAEDCSGNYINGMSVGFYTSGGQLLQSGFTPMYVNVHTTGTYLVKFNNYNNTFVEAEPGPIPVTASRQYAWGGEADLSLSSTAVYDVNGIYNTSGGTSCPVGTGDIHVTSADLSGNTLTGMFIQLTDTNNNQLDSGYTAVTFTKNPGTYKVWANDYCNLTTHQNIVFSQWSDGTATRDKTVTVSSGTTTNALAKYQITTC